MKKLIINIVTILIVVGAVIFLQHKYFPTVIDESTHTSDTIWKDSIQLEYYPKPYPVYIDTSSVDTVIIPADSVAITKAYLVLHQDFYSTYFYTDTLQDDSLALAIIDAEITQNKPVKYTYNHFDRAPSIINNTTNIYVQNEFYLGLEVGQEELSANLLFKSKKGYIFGVGFDPIRSNIQMKGYININKIKLW